MLTLEHASERLGISPKVVRRLIESGKISATQVVPLAPWEIPVEAIESEDVLQEVRRAKRHGRVKPALPESELPMFAEL